MTFLTPFPAILAASITVPLLVALYLLRLRRRPVRVSSVLFWSTRTRDLQVNVPLRWLRLSVLLLLQALILALFLLALARPAMDMPARPPARVVVLLDRSASMSARDAGGGRTRLHQAVADAERFIDDLVGDGTEACVVGFAHEARNVTGFLSDRAALRAAVRDMTPTDQPGDLSAALRLAAALLSSGGEADEPSSTPPALVALFSDGAFAGPEQAAPAGATLRYFRAGPPELDAARADNLGIVAIAARRDHEDSGTVRVFARVQNASASPVSVPVALALDGAVLERAALTVPGTDAGGMPGSAAVTFEARTTGAGVLSVVLEREDLLDADNGAAVVLAPAARPRIVVVVPDAETGASGGGAAWLLTDPLREMHPRSLRVMPASAYAQAAASDAGVQADLVVFDRVRPAAVPAAPSLSFGAGLPIPGADLAPSPWPGTPVIAWDRAHPVLRSVTMDSVFVAHPLRVVADDGADAPVETLARGRDGPLVLLVDDGVVRRLVVAFELAQSNWPLDPGFTIFLAEAVDYLTLRGEDQWTGGGGTFTTAEPAEVRITGSPERVRLLGPVTIEARVPPVGAPGAGRRVAVGVIERAGVYTVEGGDGAIAVNLLDETESAVRTRDAVRVGGEDSRAGAGGRGPRELWRECVLAALILLAVEWLVHSWLMRA